MGAPHVTGELRGHWDYDEQRNPPGPGAPGDKDPLSPAWFATLNTWHDPSQKHGEVTAPSALTTCLPSLAGAPTAPCAHGGWQWSSG